MIALVIEAMIGYPDALFAWIRHPVSWIGALIGWLDRSLNRDQADPRVRRLMGVLALTVIVASCWTIATAIQATIGLVLAPVLALLVVGLLASTCLAQRSLFTHVRAVGTALETESLEAGRRAVAMIVGRDTNALDGSGVARAAIESLAENFADGIVAPTFWLALLGLPGGATYKAINTADSMIGHRTPRHADFGFASAKVDDLVNWPAARLAGLWIVLASALTPGASAAAAWRIMRRDARGHASPNAGWPEAAMAGALGIRLGGHRVYAGRIVEDAGMGDGETVVDQTTISRALTLYRTACGINVASLVLVLIALWP